MSHPGRIAVDCRDCGAELQERPGGLRCPWAAEGLRDCGRPYGQVTTDQAGEYLRDQARKAAR